MRFPRRVNLCLLIAIVAVTLFFRYPMGFEHEVGSDTTFIHSLSNTLTAEGRAPWVLHATSYFGLYALSYPSAVPFLLTSVSTVGGISVEVSILLIGFAFSVAAVLAAYLAAVSIRPDDRLALLVALLFTISPFFVKDTAWVGSSRGFVIALVPALFLALCRYTRRYDPRELLLVAVIVTVIVATHRMGFLVLLVLIAYVVALPLYRVTLRLRFILSRYESPFRLAATGSAVGGFVIVFYLQFAFPGIAGANVVDQYSAGVFFQGTSFPELLLNMGISLTGKVGLLLPLALVGLLRLVWNRPKENRDEFLLVAVFMMIPLLSLRDYISEFLTFVLVMLAGFALFPNRRALRDTKPAAVALVLLLVVAAFSFSWVMKDYWRERYYTDGPISDELYSNALYVTWTTQGTILSNEGLSAGRITAISGFPSLPIGGASIHIYGPQQLAFGFVDGQSITVRQIELTSITFGTDEIFVPVDVPIAKDNYETIFYNRLAETSVQAVLTRYGVHYLFMENSHPTAFQSYIWRPSPMILDVHVGNYKTYDSGAFSLWYLG